jgi:hypothetical protein
VHRIVVVRRSQPDREGTFDSAFSAFALEHWRHRSEDLEFAAVYAPAQLPVVHHDVDSGSEFLSVGTRLIADDSHVDVVRRFGIESSQRFGHFEDLVRHVVVDGGLKVARWSPDDLAAMTRAFVVRRVEQLESEESTFACGPEQGNYCGMGQYSLGRSAHRLFIGTEGLNDHFQPEVVREIAPRSITTPTMIVPTATATATTHDDLQSR